MSAANLIRPGCSSVPAITWRAPTISPTAASGLPLVFRPMISAGAVIASPVVCS